jgi:hypothetical protein
MPPPPPEWEYENQDTNPYMEGPPAQNFRPYTPQQRQPSLIQQEMLNRGMYVPGFDRRNPALSATYTTPSYVGAFTPQNYEEPAEEYDPYGFDRQYGG